MRSTLIFNVLILVMFSISTVKAQSPYDRLNNHTEAKSLSTEDQLAVRAHVQSLKEEHLDLYERATEEFNRIIAPAPDSLQAAAKFWYFGRGLVSIYHRELNSRYFPELALMIRVPMPFFEVQKLYFDYYLDILEKNTGSPKDLAFLRFNLQWMELRFEYAAKHLKDIVEQGLVVVPSKVLSSNYNFADCPGFYEIDFQFNLIEMDTIANPNSISSEFLQRANSWMTNEGFVYNQKFYDFYQNFPTISCQEQAWYNILPRSKSIDYDSATNTLILNGDRDGLPTMDDAHKKLSELLK